MHGDIPHRRPFKMSLPVPDQPSAQNSIAASALVTAGVSPGLHGATTLDASRSVGWEASLLILNTAVQPHIPPPALVVPARRDLDSRPAMAAADAPRFHVSSPPLSRSKCPASP